MIENVLWIVPAFALAALLLYRFQPAPRAYRVASREIGGIIHGSGAGSYVEGTVEGFRVQVTVGWIKLEAGGGFPPVRLRLVRQPTMEDSPFGLLLLSGAERNVDDAPSPWGRDILVGDMYFDSAVIVDGPEAGALAVLDAASRRGVMQLLCGGLQEFHLDEDGLVAEGAFLTDGRDLVRRIEEVVSLAKKVASRGTVPARLATNSRVDPIADVRLRNLDVLINQFSEWPGTEQACRGSLADSNPWIRLRAARGLGREGFGVLRGLALTSAANESLAAAALEFLLGIGDREQAASVCLEVLSSGRGEARRSAIETLGRLRHAPAMQGLVRALNGTEIPVAVTAARALTLLGGEQAEAALERAVLGSVGDVQTEIVRGLSAIGSVEAIASLRALIEGERVRRAVRRLAEEAIRQIQSRLTGVEAGQLALADLKPQQGALSMVEPGPEEGRLSVPHRHAVPALSEPSGS